jgi:hypothetical protein
VAGRARFASGATAAMGALSNTGELWVRTSTLDALVQSGAIPPPDVIKMDIEGGELRALQGARHVLGRHSPTLLLATHEDGIHAACVELLFELGYECQPLDVGSAGASPRADGSLERAGELVATRYAPPKP